MLDTPCSEVECKTTGYPLYSPVSPSLPLRCVAVCRQVSSELFYLLSRLSCGFCGAQSVAVTCISTIPPPPLPEG